MNKDIGIYIHIPFCCSKCYYCDFTSYSNKDQYISQYIDSVCNEILNNSEILCEYNIISIYIGGGTPSYIDSKYITKILDILKIFITNNNVSITIEVNPNSVTEDKMKVYKEIGINRVSVGLQSTHNEILASIGRKHTYNDFLNALKIIKKYDIKDVSVDLMYPLPGLTYKLLDETLDTVISIKDEYNIHHVSIYNLEVHENTKLDFLLKEGFVKLIDEDEEFEMKENIKNKLESNNLHRYEISNYCEKGYESIHNINYWKQGIYLGFGTAASSFFTGSRYTNTKNIDDYINYYLYNDRSITVIEEKEDLDKLGSMKEYIILSLRLQDGVNIQDFYQKFKVKLLDIFNEEITKMVNYELLYKNKTNVYLTDKGKDIANIVWKEFI
ncbi:MAG: radical SAM family heme chaperone HemW [Clostridia bacterium]|nr:radical SAM family heme chaperone HemW [Clostridia bacterium]MDD4387472.1 radical SAM family heme chaperone HemW [Clostridia bacterium]